MNSRTESSKSPFAFFLLVFVLSVPFWLFGGRKLPLPVNLPASALTAFIPMISAAILAYRQDKTNGVRRLFKKALDYTRIRKIGYLPILLLAPLIYFLSYILMRLAGLPLPDRIEIAPLRVPIFFMLYFPTGVGEELGWTGYALEPLQKRWGALKASLLLGIIWAVWHAVPFIQTGNSTDWIIWQSLKTVTMRVFIVWLYNHTGKSVLAAILYHTADNISWSLFPNNGSHYNPFVTGTLSTLLAVLATVGWPANILTRFRDTGTSDEGVPANAGDRAGTGYNERKE